MSRMQLMPFWYRRLDGEVLLVNQCGDSELAKHF